MTQKLNFCTYSTHSLWSIGTWAPVLAIMAIETLYLTDKSKILHWKLPWLWLRILSQCQRVSQPMAACDVYINHYMWTVSEDMGRGGGRLHWFHALFCLVGGAIRVILTHYWEFEQWHWWYKLCTIKLCSSPNHAANPIVLVCVVSSGFLIMHNKGTADGEFGNLV